MFLYNVELDTILVKFISTLLLTKNPVYTKIKMVLLEGEFYRMMEKLKFWKTVFW